MTAIGYVMLANGLVWAGIGLYVLFLGLKTGEISRRLTQLELLGSAQAREAGHDRR